MLILMGLWLASLILAGVLSWFAAAGRCATKENVEMSEAIGESNVASLEITENATEVRTEERNNVKEIIKIRYVKAPAGECPMHNVSIFMRDVYSASAKPEVQ